MTVLPAGINSLELSDCNVLLLAGLLVGVHGPVEALEVVPEEGRVEDLDFVLPPSIQLCIDCHSSNFHPLLIATSIQFISQKHCQIWR